MMQFSGELDSETMCKIGPYALIIIIRNTICNCFNIVILNEFFRESLDNVCL